MTKRTRHFIRQPHHALSAMLDFGMEFETMYQVEMHEADKTMLLNDIMENGESQESPYYIRQSSENMLLPQVGDTVEADFGGEFDAMKIITGIDSDGWDWTALYPRHKLPFSRFPIKRIIQRNGLPFPPVETEIAEW